MKRYIKSESFDDSIALYYKHEKEMEGAIELAYAPLMRIFRTDDETKESAITYMNSFGDPLILESEHDDIDTIVSTLIDMISMDISEYFSESEFLENFYIDDINNIEIFPAKEQIVSNTQIPNVPKMTVTDFLNTFDFDYEVGYSDEFEKPCWKLIDLQGANLGGIEDDEFFGIDGIVDRLEIYYDDYLLDENESSDDYTELLDEMINADPSAWQIPYIYYVLHPDELIVDKPLTK